METKKVGIPIAGYKVNQPVNIYFEQEYFSIKPRLFIPVGAKSEKAQTHSLQKRVTTVFAP